MLSILADLLSDKRSHPFFLEWHSPITTTGADASASTNTFCPNRASAPVRISAAQLLLSIWREQDQALGLTGADGVLINLDRPLAGAGTPSKWSVDGTDAGMGSRQLQVERSHYVDRRKAANVPSVVMNKVRARPLSTTAFVGQHC